MNTTTTTTPAAHPRTLIRLATLLLALAALANATLAPAAWAAPQGPTDFKQADDQPRLDLQDSCNPDGFSYDMHHPQADPNSLYLLQWREKGTNQNNNVQGKSGFVPSGTGTFEARGAILWQGQLVHQYDWHEVTVFCPGLKPGGGGGGTDDEPTVTIDLDEQCDPEAGFSYEITVTSPPQGNTAVELQWREAPDGPVQKVDGDSGTVASGEGTFLARGVLHYQGPGFYASDFVEVVVDCTETPGGDPGDDDPDDKPRRGNPNFTG